MKVFLPFLFRCLLIGILIISRTTAVFAQLVHPSNNLAFLQDEVATVKIEIDPNHLTTILNPNNLESNTLYPATFIYLCTAGNDTVTNVGFRLRGNTSRYAEKKSFKIDINSFVPGRKWFGLEKINLNGQHNDPSLLRAFASGHLLTASQLPSSRNSFVRVYINNEYKGLYLNNEHIDEEFLQERFIANHQGNLFKANYGAELTYLGSNPASYVNLYEQKTDGLNNGYTGLIQFLAVLNNSSNAEFPCAIQQVLDVDLYLKSLAVEVLSGHWDGHAFNKNNFYLYQRPSDGKFVFIQYDMDNTFGIDWIGMNWATRDVYNWGHPGQPRPLYTRMMAVPYFKDRYTFFIDSLLNSVFNQNTIIPLLQAKQTLITQAALDDTYRELDYGYSDADFLNALSQASGGHVSSSVSTYLVNRFNTANFQTTFNGLTNPCVAQMNELTAESLSIEGYFNVLGQPIDRPEPNQPIFVRYSNGQVKKIVYIEN